MSAGIADRDIDPGDKALLRREACQIGVSMEELVRRLIHEKRTKTERRLKPSEACARIMEEELRRGAPLDDQVPDAFLAAAAATRGLAVVTRSTGEFRNTGGRDRRPMDGRTSMNVVPHTGRSLDAVRR